MAKTIEMSAWIYYFIMTTLVLNAVSNGAQLFSDTNIDSKKFKDAKQKVADIKSIIDGEYVNSDTLNLTPEDFIKIQRDLSSIHSILNKQDEQDAKADSLNLELIKAKKQAEKR